MSVTANEFGFVFQEPTLMPWATVRKNVLLPRHIRMQEILAELARMDKGKVVDITTKEFKRGGQALQIYSGTREWAFYDKVADAMRPKIKRSAFLGPQRKIHRPRPLTVCTLIDCISRCSRSRTARAAVCHTSRGRGGSLSQGENAALL